MKILTNIRTDGEKYNTCCQLKCRYSGDCANHETAGSFRELDGQTPKLHVIDGEVLCESINSEEFDDDCGGMLVIVHKQVINLNNLKM